MCILAADCRLSSGRAIYLRASIHALALARAAMRHANVPWQPMAPTPLCHLFIWHVYAGVGEKERFRKGPVSFGGGGGVCVRADRFGAVWSAAYITQELYTYCVVVRGRARSVRIAFLAGVNYFVNVTNATGRGLERCVCVCVCFVRPIFIWVITI